MQVIVSYRLTLSTGEEILKNKNGMFGFIMNEYWLRFQLLGYHLYDENINPFYAIELGLEIKEQRKPLQMKDLLGEFPDAMQ